MAVWPFGKRKRKPQEPQPVGVEPTSSPVHSPERAHTSKKSAVPVPIKSKPIDVTAPRDIPNANQASPHIINSFRERGLGRVDSSVEPSSLTTGPDRRILTSFKMPGHGSPHLRSATHSGVIHHDFGSGEDLEVNKRSRRLSKLQRKSSLNKPGASLRNPQVATMEDLTGGTPALYKNSMQSSISRSNSKRYRDGLSPNPDRPASQVSLPWLGYSDTGISPPSDARNYRISMLNMVAPRPTLRYSNPGQAPAWHASESEIDQISRQNSLRNRRAAFTRDFVREDRPVEVLAETLDSAEIREILERDQRRRERRRERKAEELKRRLERRAERERRKETLLDEQRQQIVAGTVAGYAGLGIHSHHVNSSAEDMMEPESIVETSEFTHDEDDTMDIDDLPVQEIDSGTGIRTGPWPDARRYRPASTLYEEEVVEDLPSSPPPLQTKYSFENERSESVAQVNPVAIPTPSEPAAVPSSPIPVEMQEPKRGILASFFKRGSSRRRSSASARPTPPPESSFKNVSRENMARQTPPPHLRDDFNRPRSGTPIRAQSRFREDLPELPVSPPDSRMQSPEAGRDTPFSIHSTTTYSRFTGDRPGTQPAEPMSLRSQSSIISGRESRLVSQSLASVDSEGSWLAGRPIQRLSATVPSGRFGASSPGFADIPARRRGESDDIFAVDLGDDEDDEDDEGGFYSGPSGNASEYSVVEAAPFATGSQAYIEEVDYASIPVDGEPGIPRSRGSLRIRGNSVRRNDEQADVHVISGVQRQPTVVYRGLRVKSSEGLLNQLADEGTVAETGNITPKASPQVEMPGTFFNDGPSRSNSFRDDIPPESRARSFRSFVEGHSEDLGAPTPGEASDLDDSGFVDEGLKRATSISIPARHVRNVSAGSAKLLDIVRRGSPAGQSSIMSAPGITSDGTGGSDIITPVVSRTEQ